MLEFMRIKYSIRSGFGFFAFESGTLIGNAQHQNASQQGDTNWLALLENTKNWRVGSNGSSLSANENLLDPQSLTIELRDIEFNTRGELTAFSSIQE